ncbi:MAG: CXXC-20-CXXC protein [Nonlabens sp.]|jgi:CXXC-20-CXXC protein
MKCDNCNNEFKYFRLLKSLWFGYSDIKCELCGTIYEHKMFNRLLVGLIIGASVLTTNLIFEGKTVLKVIIGYMLISVFFSLITPFVMRFKRLK